MVVQIGASVYVFTEGIKDTRRSHFKLGLHCVMVSVGAPPPPRSAWAPPQCVGAPPVLCGNSRACVVCCCSGDHVCGATRAAYGAVARRELVARRAHKSPCCHSKMTLVLHCIARLRECASPRDGWLAAGSSSFTARSPSESLLRAALMSPVLTRRGLSLPMRSLCVG